LLDNLEMLIKIGLTN